MTDDDFFGETRALPPESAQDAREAAGMTKPSDDALQRRQRALFCLFANEAGVALEEDTLFRVTAAMVSMGYAVRPIVTRF